ncbi:uncharacterized protein CC84DRAFT_53382 [Paraphaeosphaeria sporulosa]|uniref:Uncharacterized protein n=1 Tax=Paraphaeosphaeria sporulosa TaxID=1460663 RepID=A0A177CW46_9PLEO|nr:uncharacterized protein CC84DRAFT_53382 [Paraphaeosphaeria sporulosa]OAG11784.1 hypothetical protein CC84DRAFT_53382 [Paraphaeosphaeria sporulosa]
MPHVQTSADHIVGEDSRSRVQIQVCAPRIVSLGRQGKGPVTLGLNDLVMRWNNGAMSHSHADTRRFGQRRRCWRLAGEMRKGLVLIRCRIDRVPGRLAWCTWWVRKRIASASASLHDARRHAVGSIEIGRRGIWRENVLSARGRSQRRGGDGVSAAISGAAQAVVCS